MTNWSSNLSTQVSMIFFHPMISRCRRSKGAEAKDGFQKICSRTSSLMRRTIWDSVRAMNYSNKMGRICSSGSTAPNSETRSTLMKKQGSGRISTRKFSTSISQTSRVPSGYMMSSISSGTEWSTSLVIQTLSLLYLASGRHSRKENILRSPVLGLLGSTKMST